MHQVQVDAARDFFELVRGHSYVARKKAIDSGTLVEREYLIAGEVVKIIATSTTVVQDFTNALSWRLVTPGSVGETSLQIFIWDSFDLMIPPPLAPPIHPHWTVRGELPGFCNSRYQSAYLGHGNMIVSSDVDQGLSFVSLTKKTQLPTFELACPLRTSLAWHLRARDKLLIHAGAVASNTGGALLVGASGAGKSTLALKCLENGMKYLSDDLCAIDIWSTSNVEPQIYNLYSTAKVFTDEVQVINSRLLGSSARSHDPTATRPKTGFVVHPGDSSLTPAAVPLKAIIVLKKGFTSTELVGGRQAEATRILATSTSILIADSGAELLTGLRATLSQIPVFELRMGKDHVENSQAVRKAIGD